VARLEGGEVEIRVDSAMSLYTLGVAGQAAGCWHWSPLFGRLGRVMPGQSCLLMSLIGPSLLGRVVPGPAARPGAGFVSVRPIKFRAESCSCQAKNVCFRLAHEA
jgi:hypothetical protein